MNPAEFRLKTGLLGFSATSLNIIFDDLDGRAQEVLNGHAPVPRRAGEVVATWWEEVMTAVENTVADAAEAWRAGGQAMCLVRYEHHAQLPSEVGAQASSLQSWDYYLGLVIRALDKAGIPYEISTFEEGPQ